MGAIAGRQEQKLGNILIFAGTTEGRILCEYLCDQEISTTASVATEYGETVLPNSTFLQVLVGRMDRKKMVEVITSMNYKVVVDATHPYAVEVTNNIKAACKDSNIQYVRLLRERIDSQDAIYEDCVEGVVEFLNSHNGNALITTGSKDLKVFTKVEGYATRLTARVLPTWEVVKNCIELGFTGRNLICMQGPCSEEMNYATLKETGASYLVTKEAGTYGGFIEKINAAKKAGVEVIVIRRPQEELGISLSEVKTMLVNLES